jgi:HAD superfamily hydrolase (TIGR01549 family)
MAKTVIFDFDGTLADTVELTRTLFNQIAEQHHLPQIFKKDLPLLREKSARQLIKEWHVSPLQLAKITSYVHGEMKKSIETVPVIPRISEALEKLHTAGWTQGVVTSNTAENAQAFLNKHDWTYFDFVYSKKSLFGKHIVLKKLIKEKGLRAEEVWYVGDEVRDVEAARKAGIKIVSVSWGFNSKNALQNALPDYVVDNPTQLWGYLLKI